MNDLSKMRLGVLRELKNIHKFFDQMERNVKSRNPESVQKAYMFLTNLVYQMDKGSLTPDNVALDVELAIAFKELDELNQPRLMVERL